MRDFKELEVWERGHQMALDIFKMTEQFPKHEQFGLISQMRRSSESIPTNIAEGCGRESQKELIRFCSIAMGSASELEYQSLLTKDLKIITDDVYEGAVNELLILKRKLNAFIQYLKTQLPKNLKSQQ
ncbi:four helix bundle protein [Roseivirga sp. 4D4]|uniref:four helix bundle protein n=1 Tax=Roseivirga sp. 4D4 TaxID=1889784 RepID=UPI000852DAC9|nr:four helix bundle protein [Roseivirga sp. 4D4]OEK01091.1 four helix bundle protein [Roseivirga sp. 4D4]